MASNFPRQACLATIVLAFWIVLSPSALAKKVCNSGTANAHIAVVRENNMLTYLDGWFSFNPGECYEDSLTFLIAIRQTDSTGRIGIGQYSMPFSMWPAAGESYARYCVLPSAPMKTTFVNNNCSVGWESVPFGIRFRSDDDGSVFESLAAYKIPTTPDAPMIYFKQQANAATAALMKDGENHFDASRYDAARAAFDKVIQAEPNNAEAYNNRGIVKQHQGFLQDALSDLTKAIKLDPKYVTPLANRAGIYYEMKRYDEAMSDCTRSNQLEPKFGEGYRQCAKTLRALERHDEALAAAARAVHLEPNSGRMYAARAAIYEKLDRRREAIDDYKKALQLAPAKKEWADSLEKLQNPSLMSWDKAGSLYSRLLTVPGWIILVLGTIAPSYLMLRTKSSPLRVVAAFFLCIFSSVAVAIVLAVLSGFDPETEPYVVISLASICVAIGVLHVRHRRHGQASTPTPTTTPSV